MKTNTEAISRGLEWAKLGQPSKKAISFVRAGEHDTLSNERATLLDSITLAFFNFQIKHISRTTIFYLQNIAKIKNILSQKNAQNQSHVFVTSRLDYCNSLY